MIVKVAKITQNSIQKMVIDPENFLQVEDARIVKKKMLEKIMISGDKKQIILTHQAVSYTVLFASPFITGLMTAQVR